MINPNKFGRSPFPASASQWMLVGLRAAGPATGYSLSGPGAGGVGTPSTNFTVTITPAGGIVTGTVTITPSDSGGGGTFTPSTVALTTASPSATFTYTAGSAGIKTISTTNNGGLSNPSSLSYIASAALHLLNTLISYWKMDEAGAITRQDSQGTNHLTQVNGVNAGAGIINNGAVFLTASAKYLEIASNASLQATGDLTFSAWAKLDDLTSNKVILAKQDSTTQEYFLFHGSAIGFNFSVNSNGVSVGAPATINTWYHLVAWYNSSDSKCYLRVNDATTYVSAATSSLVTTTANFRIGARGNVGTEFYFSGLIDEVGLWKRVLTSAEITALYNGGAGLPFSSFNP
jgi:hypothetical protein